MYEEWLALHQVLSGKLCYTIYMLGTTIKLSMLFVLESQWRTLVFLELGLAVTEINTKKYGNKKMKNIKNVKRCRDGMPKRCKQGRDDA